MARLGWQTILITTFRYQVGRIFLSPLYSDTDLIQELERYRDSTENLKEFSSLNLLSSNSKWSFIFASIPTIILLIMLILFYKHKQTKKNKQKQTSLELMKKKTIKNKSKDSSTQTIEIDVESIST